jgi:hypothetical protein
MRVHGQSTGKRHIVMTSIEQVFSRHAALHAEVAWRQPESTIGNNRLIHRTET